MLSRLVIATMLGAAVCGAARAQTVLMDQIGPDSSALVSNTAYTSQYLGGPESSFDTAVIDNFSVGSASTITEVDAAVLGFAGFTSYSAVTSWEVDVYSSVAAAANSLTGNVASETISSGLATLTTPYGSDAHSGLVALPVSLALPAAGTYYVAVIGNLNFSSNGNAEIGVYASNYAGSPSDSNAYQVNPAGGFGLTNNENALGINAAYRVLGTVSTTTPEPESLFLLGLGVLPVTAIVRNRLRQTRS